MRYGYVLRSIQLLSAFKFAFSYVYIDGLCTQNGKYFPKHTYVINHCREQSHPVLAGQYVCVGVYQRTHEESHGRETTGTISGNNNYSIPHHSLVQGCESVDQHMNVHTLWANLSKTTWQHPYHELSQTFVSHCTCDYLLLFLSSFSHYSRRIVDWSLQLLRQCCPLLVKKVDHLHCTLL